jgi:DNA repair ATPase RecN
MYLQKLRNDDEKMFHFTYENTNLLNKISQMLVNKKMLQNSRKSIQKMNVESDEVLYIVQILSHYLGDLKNHMEEEDIKLEGMEKSHELMEFMNKYGITMEDFENIMKIDKLNKVNHTSKKKKFTMKLKKEIEGQLD